MLTDPVADLLTRIRNANMAEQHTLEVPASRLKANIVRVLKEEGYIKNFRLVRLGNNKHIIRVYLKFGPRGERVIHKISRVSRPGLRRYVGTDSIPKALNGAGTVILTTPKGVMTDKKARQERVGGEVLCTVW